MLTHALHHLSSLIHAWLNYLTQSPSWTQFSMASSANFQPPYLRSQCSVFHRTNFPTISQLYSMLVIFCERLTTASFSQTNPEIAQLTLSMIKSESKGCPSTLPARNQVCHHCASLVRPGRELSCTPRAVLHPEQRAQKSFFKTSSSHCSLRSNRCHHSFLHN